ncbi:MAG TPA: hypothetical protein VKQ36_09780 [Ktedonobacterales bacterium]|nr:hypothetical protein [Ktedonobacterales bacterium]
MMTEQFRAVAESVAHLPSEVQDQLAAALAETVRQLTQPTPAMRPEVRVAFEAAMRKHRATLDYLKDR